MIEEDAVYTSIANEYGILVRELQGRLGGEGSVIEYSK
jgi:hypothetical protein